MSEFMVDDGGGSNAFSDVSVELQPENISAELAKIPVASKNYSDYLDLIKGEITNNVWESAEYSKIKATFDDYLVKMQAAEVELNKLAELAGKLEQAVADTGTNLAGKFNGGASS